MKVEVLLIIASLMIKRQRTARMRRAFGNIEDRRFLMSRFTEYHDVLRVTMNHTPRVKPAGFVVLDPS
jgi:hypothetical protein